MKKETKFLDEYKTRINGISVVFQNVPYEEAWGSKVIGINFHSKELEKKICLTLLKHQPILTGGILKYIRSYFDYSLQKMNDEFFGKTKATLSEWESNLDKPINADSAIREKIYAKLLAVFQSKMLVDLLDTVEKDAEPYTDENPLVLGNERETYYDQVVGQ
ncbi:MAG: hypothetical protein WDA09_00225 [Bacteriovoracaceae bacterium]